MKEFLGSEHHWEEEVPGEAALHVGHRHTGQHHLVHPGHGVVAELQVLELEGVRLPVPHPICFIRSKLVHRPKNILSHFIIHF